MHHPNPQKQKQQQQGLLTIREYIHFSFQVFLENRTTYKKTGHICLAHIHLFLTIIFLFESIPAFPQRRRAIINIHAPHQIIMVKRQVQINGERTSSPTSVQDALFFILDSKQHDDENSKKKRSRFRFLRRPRNPKDLWMILLMTISSIGVIIKSVNGSSSRRHYSSHNYFAFEARPMTVQLLPTSISSKLTSLPLSKNNNKKKHHLPASSSSEYINKKETKQKQKKTSLEAMRGRADPFLTKECQQSKDWQLTSFPSCNGVHEYDLNDTNNALINNGYWRDVWRVQDSMGNVEVLKMMRYEHDFEERNYDRHRRDAVAMERLTSSDHVVDIYGFCGNSGVFQYSEEGDVHSMVFGRNAKQYSSVEMLRVAHEIAQGIASAHSFDIDHDINHATLAHTDITPSQFIRIDGTYKLNDFNRSRFIRWNRHTNMPCSYHVGRNPGKFRSPEEYLKPHVQTEKVDVYSMGNVYYVLVARLWPFDNNYERLNEKEAQSAVKHGRRPRLPEDVLQRADVRIDPALFVVVEAMRACYEQDVTARPSSVEVRDYLGGQLDFILQKRGGDV